MTYDPSAEPESESLDQPFEDGEPDAPAPERVRTGVDRVDEVIRSVEQLEERPIEEHVGVFEAAHGALRRALDDHGDGPDASERSGAGDDLEGA
jgi:hypothetical protein